MGIADDIMQRADVLKERRVPWELVWKDLADYFLPSASRGFTEAMNGGSLPLQMAVMEGPPSREPAVTRRRFDSTALWAADRLTSGVESLVTPQSEKWHGLAVDAPLAPEPTTEERRWLDRTRDYLFERRYDARSGFAISNQKGIRASVIFGTGVVLVEEAFGKPGMGQASLPMTYRYTPLYECFLDVDHQGVHDTNFRRFKMTARQMVQRWGDKVSAVVKQAAGDPKKQDTPFGVIHAVMPRLEKGMRGDSMRASRVASYYMEVETKHLIGSSGFGEFPYIIYQWSHADEGGYGESPAMLALDDVRGLNVMRKTALRAMQQWVAPPVGVAHEGMMARINLSPNAINYGAIDNNGRLKIQPIVTAQNPSGVERILESERNAIKETMYVNLFQAMIQNPSMTATEAMLRSNEKGELLGPSGSKTQMGLARMVEREIGILSRKDAFAPDALLAAPRSVQGRSISVRFTSPLDRLRQMGEANGLVQSWTIAGGIAQATGDPSVLDRYDVDRSLEFIHRVQGAPAITLATDDEMAAKREARQQQQQQAQMLQAGQAMAGMAKDAVPAAAQAQEMMDKASGAAPERAA